ncbi:hypothetical protein ACIOG3_15900 [Yersinia rochesterensis]|nr:hypothetical protein [Yersinia rochesterensis]
MTWQLSGTGANRKQLSELWIPHKNSTFCHPDVQLLVEPQEAQIKP